MFRLFDKEYLKKRRITGLSSTVTRANTSNNNDVRNIRYGKKMFYWIEQFIEGDTTVLKLLSILDKVGMNFTYIAS